MYAADRATAHDGGSGPEPEGRSAVPHPGAAPGTAAVRELVGGLAPLLGLDPGRITIEAAGPGPGGPLGGARAAAAEDRLLLRPSQLADPEPALLVHELAHIAQHRNRAQRPSDTVGLAGRPRRAPARPDLTASEAEAVALAGAVRAGSALWRPRAVLPDGVLARDSGGSGIEPRLLVELHDRVDFNHGDERARIAEYLGSFWTPADDALESALEVLEHLDFFVARALVQGLGPGVRRKLAMLSGDQYAAHPHTAAAVFAALDVADVTAVHSGGYQLGQALSGLDPHALEAAELRGVRDTLRRLAREARELTDDLLTGPARRVLRALLSAAEPPGTDEERVRAVLAEERRVSEARRTAYGTDRPLSAPTGASGATSLLLRRLTELLKSPDATNARKALDQMSVLVSPRAAKGGAPQGAARYRLSVLVTELDARGLFDRLLDHLDADDRSQGDYAPTLSALLAVRRPALTLPRIQSLLSYGLFDWAVTDDDARFAYLLVRSLPPAEQEAWRRRDGGKWYRRLQDNLPPAVFDLGEYHGVGAEFDVTGPGPEPDERQIADRLGKVVAAWRRDRTERTAVDQLEQLVGRRTGGKEAAETTYRLRAAVVRRLDAMGELPGMVAELSEHYLTAEETRHTLVALSGLRDPVMVQNHVVDLPDWLSPRRAWIAHQMLRGLSAAEQRTFDADHPGLWWAVRRAMTPAMRASPAAGAPAGQGEFPDRELLRVRLSDERLWDSARRSDLRALLNLAYRSDDRLWVLREVAKHPDHAGLEDLIQRMRQPEGLDFLPAGGSLGLLWFAAGALLQAATTLGGRTLHVDLDLDDLQRALHGDILGVQTMSPAGSGDVAQGKAAKPNRISVDLDPTGGTLVLKAPALDLRQLDLFFPGRSFHTGDVHLRGLEVRASFSDRRYRTPVGAHIDAESLDVRDGIVTDPGLPGGAAAWAALLLKNLALHADGAGEGFPGPRPGTIPVPVFGPLWQALENLVALTGGVPGAPSFLGLATMPFTPQLPSLTEFAAKRVAGFFDPTDSPFDYAAGLLTEGSLRRPHGIAERAREAADRLHSLEVSFDELSVSGLTFGTEQQISSLSLTDVTLGGARSLPAYLRLRKRALEQTRARHPDRKEAVDAAVAAIDKQLSTLLPKEGRLEELETRDRLNPGSLTVPEQDELTQLSDELRAQAGVVAHVGGLQVGQMHGRITGAGAELVGGFDLHALLPSELLGGYGAGYLPDRELVNRFLADGERTSLAKLLIDPKRRTEFELEGGRLRLLPGDAGMPALRVAAATVPPTRVLQARLDALDALGDPAVREQTAALRARLEETVALARKVEQWRDKRAPVSQQEIEDEERLLGLLGFSAETAEIGTLSGGISTHKEPDGTVSARIEARAPNIVLTGVTGLGLSAGRIDAAAGVGLRAQAGGPVDSAFTPVFSLDLTARDIRTELGTLSGFSLQGLTGTVTELPDGYRVPDLRIDRIETTDMAFGEPANGFGGRSATIEGISLDAELHQKERGAAVAVNRLSIDRITGSGLSYAHTDDHGSVRATLTSGALLNVSAENVRYDLGAQHLESAGLTIGAAKDVRFRIVSAAGLTGGGTEQARPGRPEGPGGTVVDGTVTSPAGAGPLLGARYARVGEHDFALDVDVDLGIEETRVGVGTSESVTRPADGLEIRRTRISGRLHATARETRASFQLRNTDLRALSWHSGARSVTAPGPLTIGDITVTDAVVTAPNPDSRVPAERVRRIDVGKMTVQDVRAPQVRYQDPPLDFQAGGKRGTTGALVVEKITLTDFALPFTESGGPDLDRLTGQLRATGVHLPFTLASGTVRDGLRASGRLDAAVLTVQMRPGGVMGVRGQGVSGEAGFTLGGRPVGYRHGLEAWLGFSGLDTGDITITSDAVEVSGLDLPSLSLSALQFQAGTGSQFVSVHLQEGGGLDVSGVSVSARLDRYRPGEANPQHRPFKRIVLSRFHIDRVACDGLAAQFGAGEDGVRVEVPTVVGGAPASLTGIDLGGPGGFVWTPDAAADSVLGTVGAEKLDVPRLKVAAARRFEGEVSLHSDSVKLGLLRRGESVLDMDRPSLSLLGEATLGDPRERVGVGQLRAEHLHIGEGTAKVTGLAADKLVYQQPGVRVDVEHADVPTVGLATDLSYVQIPELDLAGSGLRIDFDALGPSSPGAHETVHVAPEPARLLDSLHGKVELLLVLRGKPLPLHDPRDITIRPGEIRVADGTVDFEALAQSLSRPGGITFAPDAPVASPLAKPYFEVRGDQLQLQLPVPGKAVLEWTLPTPSDVGLARDQHRVRLRTLIQEMGLEGRTARTRVTEDQRKEKQREDALTAPRSVELTVLSSDLGARGATPLRLALLSSAVQGVIDLGTVPLDQLHLWGSVVADALPGRSTLGRLGFTVRWISVDSVDLNLSAGQKLRTGAIRISGIGAGSMSFEQLRPRVLQAKIEQASARNIEWFRPVRR
ncbi:hypothetical protein [Streptomyces anthocyanicus]|uniref:hypothetical protein n=1 Tax=Streptomyces anthocyanicus TaxID=68174 RepID=UPI00362BDF85